MFIRQRSRKLKDGNTSTTYQLVDSFRYERKVKQRVIGLGGHANPQDALKEWERWLATMEKRLLTPISEYRQVCISVKFGAITIAMPKVKAEKLRAKLVKEHAQLVANIDCLKLMQASATDTTEMRKGYDNL